MLSPARESTLITVKAEDHQNMKSSNSYSSMGIIFKKLKKKKNTHYPTEKRSTKIHGEVISILSINASELPNWHSSWGEFPPQRMLQGLLSLSAHLAFPLECARFRSTCRDIVRRAAPVLT